MKNKAAFHSSYLLVSIISCGQIAYSIPTSQASSSVVGSISLSPSHDYTTFENNEATFTFNCTGNGKFLLWTVDGYATGSSYVLDKGIRYIRFIVSPDGLTVSSQLIVPTTKANNNVTVICIVQDSLFNPQSSNPVTLFLQGTLSPPQWFEVISSKNALEVSWWAPPSLETSIPPTIAHYILHNNITNISMTISNPAGCKPSMPCNSSFAFMNLSSYGENETILKYNGAILFTFFAVTGAGNGNATTCIYMIPNRSPKGFHIMVAFTTATIQTSIAAPTTTPTMHIFRTHEFSNSIVYGTVCGASLLMISTVVGVVAAVCKHKGNTKSIQLELEQNNAYGVIKTLVPSLAQENMEPCPAYGVF